MNANLETNSAVIEGGSVGRSPAPYLFFLCALKRSAETFKKSRFLVGEVYGFAVAISVVGGADFVDRWLRARIPSSRSRQPSAAAISHFQNSCPRTAAPSSPIGSPPLTQRI